VSNGISNVLRVHGLTGDSIAISSTFPLSSAKVTCSRLSVRYRVPRCLARTLTTAPVEHFEVLLNGLQALQDELQWFRAKAAERQLDLTSPRQETCQIYCEFMGNLAHAPYSVQATALWAIEYAYNQGWQLPGPMPAPYTEFADRWGNPGFTD
jgi:hypothetical protein